jgi:hypothetical protein
VKRPLIPLEEAVSLRGVQTIIIQRVYENENSRAATRHLPRTLFTNSSSTKCRREVMWTGTFVRDGSRK